MQRETTAMLAHLITGVKTWASRIEGARGSRSYPKVEFYSTRWISLLSDGIRTLYPRRRVPLGRQLKSELSTTREEYEWKDGLTIPTISQC